MKTPVRICLFALVAILLLSAVGVGMYHTLPYRYDQSELYAYGSGSYTLDTLQSLYIHWLSGTVTIKAYDGATVSFSESDIPDDNARRLHHAVQDGTLSIRYCQNGILPRVTDKHLTVFVPEKLSLPITVEGVKVNVVFDGGRLENVTTDVTAGMVRYRHVSVNKLTHTGQLAHFSFIGSVNKADIYSKSGECTLESALAPKELIITTDDAQASLKVPQNAAFTAEFYTKSGEMVSGFDGKNEDGKLIVGKAPTASYLFVTDSGSVTLSPVALRGTK